MRPGFRPFGIVIAIIVASAFWHHWLSEPLVLSFRVGQRFEDVVTNSTYPVMERSNLPQDDPTGFGGTYVTKPPVIVKFDDSQHGFILPPTSFAVITYEHATAVTIATSPMVKKLPFEEVIAILENLQNQFKKGGWEPWSEDGSEWFDFSPKGKQELYLRMFKPGYMHTVSLRVPKKYGMTFRLKCAEGCWTRKPPYRFLIDVGVGTDTEGWEPGDPEVWEQNHPAVQASGDNSSVDIQR